MTFARSICKIIKLDGDIAMMTIAVGFSCLAIGLYAGKKRANGSEWSSIARDLWNGFTSALSSAFEKVLWSFRKDGKNGDNS